MDTAVWLSWSERKRMKILVRHFKTSEIGVRTMSGVSFNNRRLGAAQENEQAHSFFLMSIQGINNLREGPTVIDCANKHSDKLSGGSERGISKAVILQEKQTCI